PLVLFWLLWRFARSQGESPLARFALGVLLYGVFQLAVAMVLLGPASLVRLTPLQPMRFLQLIYVFLALMAGCLMGRHLLKASALRWSLFLLLVNGAMFVSQRMLLSASEHLELPGSSRPVESHHQPLTKPCLRLSPHTAFHGDRDASSQKQPLSVVVRRFLLVAQLTKTTHLAMSPSWLPAHYRRFNATPGRSAIFNCIDISPSWFSLIGFLLASVEDFPCF